jgi:hypothetical protein
VAKMRITPITLDFNPVHSMGKIVYVPNTCIGVFGVE